MRETTMELTKSDQRVIERVRYKQHWWIYSLGVIGIGGTFVVGCGIAAIALLLSHLSHHGLQASDLLQALFESQHPSNIDHSFIFLLGILAPMLLSAGGYALFTLAILWDCAKERELLLRFLDRDRLPQ